MRFPMIRRSHLWLGLAVAGLVLATLSFAQAPSAPPPAAAPSDSQEGKDIGGFHVTQSIEFGGRINETTGSTAMYDTLVNYQSGARILDQSLTMQAKDQEEIFDTLTLSSFGWGGDPEQAARLRIAKYSWYNFSGSYQHMQNYFDYDLLANPLNPAPPVGNPSVPVQFSPHSYFDRQNLYNFDLVVLPMHKLSFRAGYNRNRIIGPSFSSTHEGTEALLNENWNNQLNGFRFGADWRANEKTTISYTQLLQYYTGGTTDSLNPYNIVATVELDFGQLRTAMVQQRQSMLGPVEEWNCQPVLQWLPELQPVSARAHLYSHRAAQHPLVVVEMARLQWAMAVQPRADEHAADSDL